MNIYILAHIKSKKFNEHHFAKLLPQCDSVLGGHQGVAKQLLRPSEKFLAKVFGRVFLVVARASLSVS